MKTLTWKKIITALANLGKKKEKKEHLFSSTDTYHPRSMV